INQKGGVGKTTTTVNLGASLAALEKRVLLVGNDAQCGLAASFGLAKHPRRAGLYNVLMGEVHLEQAIRKTALSYLDVITCNVLIQEEETRLQEHVGTNLQFQKSILQSVAGRYDYVLIDCPPSMGPLTISGLIAADSFLTPVQCELFSISTVGRVSRTAKLVKDKYNPALKIAGFLLTMVNPHAALTEKIIEQFRAMLRDKVFQTIIPRDERLSEIPHHGRPIIMFDIYSPGAQAYLRLAAEILAKNKSPQSDPGKGNLT
ncbi:MAG: ParA family protein, partial [Deltaproteobacteria bacterium]|nr:ParA family protein [Deltaproteobacteria bacterium]